VTVAGGSFGRVTFSPTSASSETIQQYSDAAGTTLLSTTTFSSSPTLVDSSAATVTKVNNLPAGTHTFADDPGTVAGLSAFSGTAVPTTSFANPSQQLLVTMAGAGTLNLNAMDPAYAPSAGRRSPAASGPTRST